MCRCPLSSGSGLRHRETSRASTGIHPLVSRTRGTTWPRRRSPFHSHGIEPGPHSTSSFLPPHVGRWPIATPRHSPYPHCPDNLRPIPIILTYVLHVDSSNSLLALLLLPSK